MGNSFSDLTLEKSGATATIALDRPERLNALGAGTTMELCSAVADAVRDPGIRVIVLTGRGRAFCAGGDFRDNFLANSTKSSLERRSGIRTGANRLIELLTGCEKPVIAAINGPAVGGGATLALACDIRIASEKATFRFPFSGIGLTPEFGCTYLLPRLVGPGKALELLYAAEFVDAAEALRIGLVNRVVAHERLGKAVAEFVELLEGKSAAALGMIKSLVYRSLSGDLATQLELEAFAIGAAFNTDEHREAVDAFLHRPKGT